MRYISVCSGIESATVAWEGLGWEPIAFSEIDPHASALLHHHYPNVPNLGDFTNIGVDYENTAGLIVGGTPCQSFSVIGNRRGLDDPRGNLAIEFVRLANRLRCRWILFENVPGILSSDGGLDFRIFLRSLAQFGYGFAYRILDAQYIRTHGYPRAVPQRRRRVFVVGYIGDWRPPAAVLFEPKMLRGTAPPSRQAGEKAATTVTSNLGTGGFNDSDLALTIGTKIRYDLDENYTLQNDQVRQITPVECERLMGFPDDYTLVPYRNRMMADSARYRMLGNSMAVNVIQWIGNRINMFEKVYNLSHI